MSVTNQRALVTGATGYIGGRLVPELLAAGFEVVCLVRSPDKLAGRAWADAVEVVVGDGRDRDAVEAAAAGASVAYYLIHSMDGGGDFRERDRELAATFRDAAAAAGVSRIVYLGGLGGGDDEELSHHLRSRQEVGRILADGPVPVTELRAAMIIGSGSASFEMLRHLVEVLPVMVTPRWVDTRCQPVAIRDVLFYLVVAADHPEMVGRVLEVGGPDVLTYRELMQEFADVAGLPRRRIVPVPLLTPRLSSLWIGLVTPLPTGLARPLIDSLVNEVTVGDAPIGDVVDRDLLPFREAVHLALRRVKDLEVPTTWSDAATSGPRAARPEDPRPEDPRPEDPRPEDPAWSGGTLLTSTHEARSSAPPEVLWDTASGIGGETGYHAADELWQLRGAVDVLIGGIGMRRGRRHPTELRIGDPIDFWRVEQLDPPRHLRLRAEAKLPGDAWLDLEVTADGEGSRLRLTSRFRPRGLAGRLYWHAIGMVHGAVFDRMARGIATAAEHTQVPARRNRSG